MIRADDLLYWCVLGYAVIVTILALVGWTRTPKSVRPERDALGRFTKRPF